MDMSRFRGLHQYRIGNVLVVVEDPELFRIVIGRSEKWADEGISIEIPGEVENLVRALEVVLQENSLRTARDAKDILRENEEGGGGNGGKNG